MEEKKKQTGDKKEGSKKSLQEDCPLCNVSEETLQRLREAGKKKNK